jgi:hypothetical protein
MDEIDAVECLRHLLAAIDGFESGEVWRGRDRIAKMMSPRAAGDSAASLVGSVHMA